MYNVCKVLCKVLSSYQRSHVRSYQKPFRSRLIQLLIFCRRSWLSLCHLSI